MATETIERPVGGFSRLADIANDTWSGVIWGTEGTGKTLFVLQHWPAPIMVLNLDRPLTRAHLGAIVEPRRWVVSGKDYEWPPGLIGVEWEAVNLLHKQRPELLAQ